MATNPLATPRQVETEDLALRLFESGPLRQSMERMRTHYLADPRGVAAIDTHFSDFLERYDVALER